jgi:ABC transporter substrate binding protein
MRPVSLHNKRPPSYPRCAGFDPRRSHGPVALAQKHSSARPERRFSEGRAERLPALAAELVQQGVSVIVASAPGPSRAAKEATTTVPIVFVGVADPVGFGLVASLARPGGNVTGLASIEWEAFQAKQLQVIKEALPAASRVAIPRESDDRDAFADAASGAGGCGSDGRQDPTRRASNGPAFCLHVGNWLMGSKCAGGLWREYVRP